MSDATQSVTAHGAITPGLADRKRRIEQSQEYGRQVFGPGRAAVFLVTAAVVIGVSESASSTQFSGIATALAALVVLVYAAVRIPQGLARLRDLTSLHTTRPTPLEPADADALSPWELYPDETTSASRLDRILACLPADRPPSTRTARLAGAGFVVILITVMLALLTAAVIAVYALFLSDRDATRSLFIVVFLVSAISAVEYALVDQYTGMTRRERAHALHLASFRIAAGVVHDDGQPMTVLRRTDHGLVVDPAGLRTGLRPKKRDLGKPVDALSAGFWVNIVIAVIAAPILAVLLALFG
jgi:hypothetical protein